MLFLKYSVIYNMLIVQNEEFIFLSSPVLFLSLELVCI